MKKTILMTLAAAGILALPTRASEVGLAIDKQFGSSNSTGAIHWDAINPTGFALRGAFTVLNLKVAELAISGAYHLETKEDLIGSSGGYSAKAAEYKQSYISLGAQMQWKLAVDVTAALELRQDSLKLISTNGYSSGTTNYLRPWVRGGVGFAIPAPAVKPFVRFEAAFTPVTGGSTAIDASDDEANKAFAPKFQIGVYAGVRF